LRLSCKHAQDVCPVVVFLNILTQELSPFFIVQDSSPEACQVCQHCVSSATSCSRC
jgi:hypothetical protein